jgi:ABC-2 type transport system ATP-binding protein
MSAVIRADGLSKSYGGVRALDDVSFVVEPGRIVGLIGPNGAGKTTALKAILGLTPYQGSLSVLGHDPYRARDRLMQEVSFIADVATLPRWLRVRQVLELMPRIHPRFQPERARTFLQRTEVRLDARVRELSKGMIVQLHLALVMAIDARLLVLDEPTLGLDILYRKAFYEALLTDYFDEQRTILVTTHQVEEVEHILTDLMFIQHGRLVLNATMDAVQDSFIEVLIAPERVAEAEQLRPLYRREMFGKKLFLFEGVARDRLERLGELHRPSVADLFVAKMKGAPA